MSGFSCKQDITDISLLDSKFILIALLSNLKHDISADCGSWGWDKFSVEKIQDSRVDLVRNNLT